MPSAVAVEEVTGGKAMVRFVELPQALHGADQRWAPPVMAWERYRLDPHRNPYFERGDAVYLLARRLGQPVGRIVAHLATEGGEGRFGFFSCVDDVRVATALVDAAQEWLRDQGCSSMTGPYSFEPGDEPGVLVDGFDAPGVTGRPWHPAWEAQLLEALGFTTVEEQPWWRLAAGDVADRSTGTHRPVDADRPAMPARPNREPARTDAGHAAADQPTRPGHQKADEAPEDAPGDAIDRPTMPPRRDADEAGDETTGHAGVPGNRMATGSGPDGEEARDGAPGHAGPYADRRLVLPDVAAVPDVAEGLRSSSFRTAWRLAKRARAGDWETCTVVRCTIDPAVAVPELCAAAAAAGYRWVVAPWSPDAALAPEAVHRIVRRTW
jgi:hypothetical protein